MEKNKRILRVFIAISFLLGIFPIIEFFLAQQGLSTCGGEGLGCKIVGLVTPYGATPFLILGSTFGFALGIAAIFRQHVAVPALLCAGVVMEGVLLAFQVNLGYFCQFCLIYSLGVLTLTALYIWIAPRTSTVFAIPFGTAFLSIFLLYFSFAGASLEKAYIMEESFGDDEPAHFYLLYSNTCGHCIKTLQILDHNKDRLKGSFRLVVTDANIGRAEAAKQATGDNIFKKALKGIAGDPVTASDETISQCSIAKRYTAKHAISETPTMIVVDGEKWTTIVSGTNNILDYLSLRFQTEFEREIP